MLPRVVTGTFLYRTEQCRALAVPLSITHPGGLLACMFSGSASGRGSTFLVGFWEMENDSKVAALGGRKGPENHLFEPSVNTMCGVCRGGGVSEVLTVRYSTAPPPAPTHCRV